LLARLSSIVGRLRRFRAVDALSRRAALVGVVALCALMVRMREQAPPPPTPDGMAEMLGMAIGGAVHADDFVWEPSRGGYVDALLGRDVLFLGVAEEEENRDLFRARVRVSREGRPIEVERVRNVSQTPLGDETHLIARGRWVAYASVALGAVQGLTVLDLAGKELPPGDRWARLRARLDNWLEVGTFDGVGRSDVAFHNPPQAVKMELQDERLVMALGDPPKPAALDLTTTALITGGDNPYEAWAWRTPPRTKPTPHFVMDGLRSVFGTEAADTFKSVLFDARSRWVQWTEGGPQRRDGSAPLPAFEARDGSWPPASLKLQFDHPQEGEGKWRAPSVSWLPKPEGLVGDADPYLLETFIRPDPALPFATVHLVAIDTRQLELRIEAGFEEPRPLTGPAGRGRIPERDRPRLVAAFNGAFQTRHGKFGMVVDGRVLLPPKPHASTVAVDARGRTRFGTWGKSEEVPPDLVSLRQNLDPLIENGVINPRGRKTWGFPLEGGSYLTERSAICRTSDGYLIYGYGIELDAITLARGLLLAGCSDAMHLDMNPGHVGFVYHNAQAKNLSSALLTSTMSIAPNRFVKASPKDFFYLVMREHGPRVGDVNWKPAPGSHPPPAWLPAVYTAKVEKLGTEVGLMVFETDRFRWEIRPGEEERTTDTAPEILPPAKLARAMVGVGLGVAHRKDNQRGLFIDGVEKLPIRSDLGVLTTSPDGKIDIAVAVEPMAPPGGATELVLFAEAQRIRVEAKQLGARRNRSAACMLDEHTLVLAIGRADNGEPMTRALVELGCSRVVELDRGKQVQAFIHRAGTDTPPQASYEDTSLYGMAVSAGGEALPLWPSP
jgi:hypothetical protein